jgi:OOP family OmpA-OmpF porin
MNYSTLKKTVVLSFVSLMAVGMAQAQTTTADTSKASGTTTPKVFGGTGGYNTWSVGINVGLTSGQVPFMTNAANDNTVEIGYGVTLRDQLSHTFSLRFDYNGGTVSGYDAAANGLGTATAVSGATASTFGGLTYYSTKFNSFGISGVFNIGAISFLHRQSGIIFYASSGIAYDVYTPSYSETPGVTSKSDPSVLTYPHSVKDFALPIGGGIKFKLSDNLDLNLGYTATIVNNFNFAGAHTYPIKSHYGYDYAGLEYTFGAKGKPSLEWANPVALMYDELYDAALRQEVEALKGRVTNVEAAVNELKKDSDGDGVSDQFDKCPNTPAGTVVDGSGCPLVIPPPIDTSLFVRKTAMAGMGAPTAAYSNIQFEFDSSVLKTSSYPILDATSADLRATGASAELDGFASSEGTAAHNMRLSKDRAESVKTYLVNSGVAAKKLKVKAFGETHPVADNSTEAGRILNRRVEFKKR